MVDFVSPPTQQNHYILCFNSSIPSPPPLYVLFPSTALVGSIQISSIHSIYSLVVRCTFADFDESHWCGAICLPPLSSIHSIQLHLFGHLAMKVTCQALCDMLSAAMSLLHLEVKGDLVDEWTSSYVFIVSTTTFFFEHSPS